jgi:hypothetical protein
MAYYGNKKALFGMTIFAIGAVSQSNFEPANFNTTEALLKNGVNASAIPDLALFVERSSSNRCSAAVSHRTPYHGLA